MVLISFFVNLVKVVLLSPAYLEHIVACQGQGPVKPKMSNKNGVCFTCEPGWIRAS